MIFFTWGLKYIVNVAAGRWPHCKELWWLRTSVPPCPASMHSTHCLRLWWSQSSLLCFRQPAGLACTPVEMGSVLSRVSRKCLLISLHHTSCPRSTVSPTCLLRSQTFYSGCFSLQRPSNPLQGSGEHPTHTLTGLAAGIWGHLSGCGGEGRPCPSGHVERGSLRHCGGTATRVCRSYFHMSLCHLVPAGATGPTTLRCPAIVLAEQDLWARVPAQPWPTPIPKEVPSAQGCGCPSAPWLPWFWLRQWNGPQLSGPALTDTGSSQNIQPKGSPGLLQQPGKI